MASQPQPPPPHPYAYAQQAEQWQAAGYYQPPQQWYPQYTDPAQQQQWYQPASQTAAQPPAPAETSYSTNEQPPPPPEEPPPPPPGTEAAPDVTATPQEPPPPGAAPSPTKGQAAVAATQPYSYGQTTPQPQGAQNQAWVDYTYQQAAWQQHQGYAGPGGWQHPGYGQPQHMQHQYYGSYDYYRPQQPVQGAGGPAPALPPSAPQAPAQPVTPQAAPGPGSARPPGRQAPWAQPGAPAQQAAASAQAPVAPNAVPPTANGAGAPRPGYQNNKAITSAAPDNQALGATSASYQPQAGAASGYQPQRGAAPGYQPQGGAASGYQAQGGAAPGYQPHAGAAKVYQPQAAGYQPQAAAASGYQSQAAAASGYQPQATPTAGYQPNGGSATGQHPQAVAASGYQPQGPAAYRPQGVSAGFTIKPKMSRAGQNAQVQMQAAPAFLKVPERKEAKPAAPPGGAGQWPPSLRSWVERAFKAAKEDPDRVALQEALKQIISDAQEKGEVWTRDWDNVPLPSNKPPAAPISVHSRLGAPAMSVGQKKQPPYKGKPSRYDQAQRWDIKHRSRSWSRTRSRGRSRSRSWSRSRSRSWSRSSQSYSRSRSRSPVKPIFSPMGRKKMKNNKKWKAAAVKGAPVRNAAVKGPAVSNARMADRAGRFGDGAAKGAVATRKAVQADGSEWAASGRKRRAAVLMLDGVEDIDWDDLLVKGTCQELEKGYFRLTSAPDPLTVRPELVLAKALDRLVGLLRARSVTYFYAQDQFKGMRQDCTVQHLRNELTARIYEAHARAALEYGDVAEYNQCQTQLDVLYRDGVAGCREEFLAYRILYQTVHSKQGEATSLLRTLRLACQETGEAVLHALQVRSAVYCDDFPAFFRLYGRAPNMGRALLDMYVPRFRFHALNIIVRAFRPHVPVGYLVKNLGFGGGLLPSDAATAPDASAASSTALAGCSQATFNGKFPPKDTLGATAECLDWLHRHGAVVIIKDSGDPPEYILDCKASAGTLSVPEDVSAVAHGDANLAIEDFLKSALL